MADENSTTFVGSHEKAENGYGQNGYQGASSLTPGQTKPNIAGVSPPTANVPGLDPRDQLGFRIKPDATPVPIHSATPHRTTSSGSPGGTVPAKTNRPQR